MFILYRRFWGPLAGVATALLFVLLLGTDADAPAQQPAAAAVQMAFAPADRTP
jgi:hypothetical protein